MNRRALAAYVASATIVVSTFTYKLWDGRVPKDLKNVYESAKNSNPLKDKTIIVTGANGGVGVAICRQILRQQPKRVLFTCKNASDCMELKKKFLLEGFRKTRIDCHEVDFGQLQSVKVFSDNVHAQVQSVDAFINCSGWFGGGMSNPCTADGVESHLAINLLGPYMLTELLMDLFQKSKQCRLIYMLCPMTCLRSRASVWWGNWRSSSSSSDWYELEGDRPVLNAKKLFDSFRDGVKLNALQARTRSQVLLMSYLERLVRRLSADNGNVEVTAVDPDIINTNYYRNMSYKRYFLSRALMKPLVFVTHRLPETGSFTPLYLLLRENSCDRVPDQLVVYKNIAKSTIWSDILDAVDDPEGLMHSAEALCKKWTEVHRNPS